MSNRINEYIVRKKRNKLIKKISIISIFILAILAFISFKAPAFNIITVEIKNNSVVQSDKVVEAKKIVNKNIFLTNLNDIKNEVLLEPYIKDAKVERKLPNKIRITVEERTATFGVIDEGSTYVLNEELIIMEDRASLDGLNLSIIDGLSIENRYLGEVITEDNRKVNFLKDLGDIINKDKKIKIDSINIIDINNISMNIGDIKIIIGQDNNLNEKMSKAFNILNTSKLSIESGYIDVSFNGNPVIYDANSSTE